MRIMVLTDPIWNQPPSGYSKMGGNLCQLLVHDGHEVAHVPIDGGIRGTSMLKGHSMTWKGTLLLSANHKGDISSERAAMENYYEFKPDCLITLKDIINFSNLGHMPLNWVPIAPVDHSPISEQLTRRIQTAFKVVAITRFGKRELKKAGIPSVYAPLWVNTQLYKKVTPRRRTMARKFFGLPKKCFAILILGMNRRRKMITRLFNACKIVMDEYADTKTIFKIILWSQLTPEFFTDDGARGSLLAPKARRLGILRNIFAPGEKLYKIGLSERQMPNLYHASNVIICGSAEGFWLPGVEAGACGIPSVVAAAGAAPEVTTGELAKVADWDVMNPVGYEQPLVDVHSMAEGIGKIFNGDAEKYAEEARSFTMKYDLAYVYKKYWQPFFKDIEPELRPLVKKGGIESWKLQ